MSSDDGPRGRLRPAFYRGIERAWGAAFAVASVIVRDLPPSRLVNARRGPVLIVAPHPDDESLACGGSIALHAAHGDDVHVVIVTDGSRSTRATAEMRAQEALAAARVLGGRWTLLALVEGAWDEDSAAERLRDAIHDTAPQIVYGPSCVDYHPEHVRVAGALARALIAARSNALVRVFEVGVPLTPVLANRCVDISAVAPLKLRALAEYRSQRDTIAAVGRLQRHNARLYPSGGEIEVFRELTVEGYTRFVAAGAQLPPRTFHGVRHRPFSDPWCYLQGLRARWGILRAECP